MATAEEIQLHRGLNGLSPQPYSIGRVERNRLFSLAPNPGRIGNVIGRTYLERGVPVVVLIRWGGSSPPPWSSEGVAFDGVRTACGAERKHGPRNVLIRREGGEMIVRSFRGLRRAEG